MKSVSKFFALFVGGIAAFFAVMASPPEMRPTAHANNATLQQEVMSFLCAPALRVLAFVAILALLAFGFYEVAVKAGVVFAVVLFFALDAACTAPQPGKLAVNSLGTIVGAKIIQRALQLTFARFPSLNMFSMGFRDLDGSVSGADLNQPVYSRILGVSPVTNFESGASNFSMTDVPGRLSNYRQIHHRFTSAEIHSTELSLIDQAAMPMAIGLAQTITASMASLVCRANFNATSNGILPYFTVASGWTYANTLVPLQGMLNDRGVPNDGRRYVIASTLVDNALLSDVTLVTAFNNPNNQDAIMKGKLPTVMAGVGYDRYAAFNSTDSNMLGWTGTPDALMYIARAPKSPDEVFAVAASKAPFAWAIITDERTGFSVLVQQWMETNMAVNTRLVWLDGYVPGNTNNLVRLINGVVTGTSGVPLAAAKVTNPGYGYVNNVGVPTAPTVTVVPVGAGSGATAVATIDAVGGITGIAITGGTGYASGFTLSIVPVGGGSTNSAATAVGVTAGLN